MDRFDVVIRDGTVLDGTGAEPVRADVGILDERVAAMGDLAEADAGQVVDGAGRRVAPGFIDIHTHSDVSVLFNPGMDSMVSQGVTTQVVGNCGLSIGLTTDADEFAFEKRWLGVHGVRVTWDTIGGHLRRIEEQGTATNYATLAGQGTLRKRIMGQDDRAPTSDEMARMKAMLCQALEDGAWGVSTGLEYTPSRYADVDELSELSAVLRDYGGFYATHLRSEGDGLLESVAEAIEIGERAGVPVQLSHHKAEGQRNWGKVRDTLRMVEEARGRGIDVQLDQYPYTAFQTSMSVQFLPPWANVGDNDTVLSRLTHPRERQAILDDIRANHADWEDLGPGSMWERVEITTVRRNRALQGRTVADLAREASANPVELVLDLIAEERNFISAVNFAISEDDIAIVMRHPLTMIGSDAVGTSPWGRMGEDRVHPRCYGTFPRVLGRYVRQEGILTEAEAVRKMTSLPAMRLGIPGRGRIEVGAYADLVVYDPAQVSDRSTFAEPHRFARGIDRVFVNGRVVWDGEKPTGARPGRVLRRG